MHRILSSGIIPIFWNVQGPTVLLLRIYNYWDFPKGMVERGEEPLVGAMRELREETTLQRVEFPWGQEFQETEPYAQGKIARYYLGEVVSQEVRISHEHHEYRWMRFEEAARVLSPRVKAVLEWAARRLGVGLATAAVPFRSASRF